MLPLAFQDPTPSPPQSKPSGRKGNKKVRTGCITCKVRKVKCDEGKPFCERCVKTGRKCDGYRATPPRSTPGALSPIPAFGSDRESRAFDYYRSRSAKVLSGAIDMSFWGDLVLKLSATEPAVRHAILAVSDLHEYVDVKSKTGRELDRRFAFQEYGNAIRSLRNWADRDEPSTVPLLVCILFICIEFLAKRTSASQMHIAQGRNILFGLPNRNSPSTEIIKRSLVPIYVRLSLASFLFGNKPATIPDHLKSWTEIPAIFTCIEDARRGLYQILDEGLQFSTRSASAVFDPSAEIERQQFRQERQQLLSQFARWHSAFTVLISMTPRSSATDNVQNLLLLYYHAGTIWVTRALDAGELSFDDHLSDFASIISLASSIIGSLPNDATMETFSFETELIAPVYWTATKCRHPLLRRAAVKLLTRDQMHGRRENLWDARDVAVVAARVIEKEEADASYSNFDNSPGSSPSPFSDEDCGRSTTSRPGLPEVRVDITQPPRLPGPTPSFTDPMEDIIDDEGTPMSSPESADSEPSLIATAIDAIQQLDLNSVKAEGLEPPFGIPGSRRIVNTVIGPPETDGIWATYFQEPGSGQTEWNITREFVRF